MNRGSRLVSILARPMRGVVMQQSRRMPRASLPFPAMQNPRSFSVSSAELDKLSILRKSVADEFNIEVKMEGVSNTLDENPNYDYVFEALKHDSEGHEDEACLHDTLATFAAIDTDRSGYLDKNELRTAVRMLLKHDVSNQELDNIFDKMDLNHDGKIDYFEFEESIQTLTAQADMEEEE